MNTWHGIGRLTHDPELRATTGGNATSVCRFRIAVNDGYGEKQTASFITIVTFGKTAEAIERNCFKGKQVAVTGRISTGEYTRKDGIKMPTFEIIANNVEFLGGERKQKQETAEEPTQETFIPQGFDEIDDDDVPF